MRAILNPLLHATCLKARYSLRRQLVVGYGFVAVVTIVLAIVFATIATLRSKTIVQQETEGFLVEQRVEAFITANAIMVSDLVDRRAKYSWRGSAALLSEFITDRYYQLNGNGNRNTFDINTDVYPLRASPLPSFINTSNWDSLEALKEHAFLVDEDEDDTNGASSSSSSTSTRRQRRRAVFEPLLNKWSTETAMCWNCSTSTPSPESTTQVAADVGALLKPIWESEPAAYQIRIGFFGGGTVFFPSFIVDDAASTSTPLTYRSSGCAWMVRDINPNTNQHYGTREDVKRCKPSGFQVDAYSDYNVMELSYCQDQIQHAGETRIYGPHLDVLTNHWVLTVGQAVFDPNTGEFVACTAIDLAMELLFDDGDESGGLLREEEEENAEENEQDDQSASGDDGDEKFGSRTKVAVVRPDGTVIAISSSSSPSDGNDNDARSSVSELKHITDTGFLSEETWNAIINDQWGVLPTDAIIVESDDDNIDNIEVAQQNNDSQQLWNANNVQQRLSITHVDDQGRTFAAVPSPLPPKTYDPLYRPDFFVIESASGKELALVLEEISFAIEEDTKDLIVLSVSVGLAGLVIFMTIVFLVSKILTRPLKYMESISWRIVNHSTEEQQEREQQQQPGGFDAGNRTTSILVDQYKESKSPLLPCTPQTEISQLVAEFQVMIHGFSGTGASRVALPNPGEITNCVTWKEPFGRLYDLTCNLKEELKKEQRNSFNELSESMKKLDDSFMVYNNNNNGIDDDPNGLLSGSLRVSAPDMAPRRRKSSLLRSSIVSLMALDEAILEEDDEDNSAHMNNNNKRHSSSNNKQGVNNDDDPVEPAKAPRNRRQSLLTSSVVSLSPMDFLAEVREEEEEEMKKKHEDNAMFRSASMMDGASASAYFGGRVNSSAMFRVGGVTRTNLGPNASRDNTSIPDSDGGAAGKPDGMYDEDESDVIEELWKISRSSLFRWILVCIALPLLMTLTVICTVVALELLNSFPTLVQKGDDLSFDLGKESMRNTATLRALQTEQNQQGSLRDLYILTRGAGWLLFDALHRSDVFADVDITLAEECKTVPADELCPFQSDDTRSPCDCEWLDLWKRECSAFPSGSRHLQRPFYINQARDFDPVSGYRNESLSFPEFDSTPETTLWWTDVSAMPGAEKGTDVSGYVTTYDRLRVIAALSAISLPLYNYITRDRLLTMHSSMSSYVAYEPDGGYWGYSGCADDTARYAHWQSTEGNAAHVVSPELCPLGKYGYDPRCRSWYANTKKNALEFGEGIHVTAPYIFATVDDIGITAGSPIVDPQTGEYVATTAIDVPLEGAFPTDLPQTDSEFFFVVSPDSYFEADAILGPGFPFGSPPMPIADLVLPNDEGGSENRENFDAITTDMKLGASGENEFTRTTPDGSTQQKLFISYAPVFARILTPISPDDYSRGADLSQVLLYSLAVVRSEESLDSSFQEVQDNVEVKIRSVVAVYLASVAAVAVCCILFAAKISVAVTKPMMILLRIVQRVNAGRIEGDLPPMSGGSREVNQVYASFAKLYKIVRMSNSSFFSGNFKWAHHIARDALKLFRRIDDEKAIAIACNNSGNTLLALSMQSRTEGKCEMVDGVCCVKTAIEHFNEAIEIGQRQFESGETDDVKADFAQQLADRHFNRAICLLHSVDDPCVPENAREVAYMDLIRCRDYDLGVQEYSMHAKLVFKNSDVFFERSLRRLHGLASLCAIDSAVWQIWDVNELIDQTDLMLQAAWHTEDAPLFKRLTKVGRLQQLEGAVVDLEISSGKVEEAAKLAMRMLIEDEYILETSFAFAADCLLRVIRESNDDNPWPKAAVTGTRYEFQRMRKLGKRTTLDIGRCFIFCIELSDPSTAGASRSLINQECLSFYDEHCDDGDVVGIVGMSNSVDSNFIVKLGPKQTEVVEQRAGIMKAIRERARSTSYPALPTAVNMVLDTARSNAQDAILVYVTDGAVWDPHSFSVMEKKINEANERRTSNIDIIAVGVGMDENDEFSGLCNALCLAARSRQSKFYCSTLDELEQTFDNAGLLIASRSSAANSRVLLGTTMEKF